MSIPFLSLALDGPQLVELLADDAAIRRWDELPSAFSVLGVERVDGSGAREATVDASVAAAILAGRTTRARFLVAASPTRDHPYNLARRVASLGHLSRGRSGVIFGDHDPYAPAGDPWTTTDVGFTRGAQIADALRAVRALEQSWPYESVVGDLETGIFVQSNLIRHVDHDGLHRTAGPLTVPEPPTGASVTAWLATDRVPAIPGDETDLVIGAGGAVRIVDADAAEAWSGEASDGGGLLLRGRPGSTLAELLDAAESLAGRTRPVGDGPLRQVLDLSVPSRPAVGRAAFPQPQPHAVL